MNDVFAWYAQQIEIRLGRLIEAVRKVELPKRKVKSRVVETRPVTEFTTLPKKPANSRIMSIEDKFVAQVKNRGKWWCLDKDGKHKWDYEATTADWVCCRTIEAARKLLYNYVAMDKANLKGVE